MPDSCGDPVVEQQLLHQWHSSIKDHITRMHMEEAPQRNRKNDSLHNYRVDELSKKLESTLFTLEGM